MSEPSAEGQLQDRIGRFLGDLMESRDMPGAYVIAIAQWLTRERIIVPDFAPPLHGNHCGLLEPHPAHPWSDHEAGCAGTPS